MPARRRIAERQTEAVTPEVWVVDDVSFPEVARLRRPMIRAAVGIAREASHAVQLGDLRPAAQRPVILIKAPHFSAALR